jgi:hypothetical protein
MKRKDSSAAIVVVVISMVTQYVIFGITLTDSVGPAVLAAGGYLIAVATLRRIRERTKDRRPLSK